GRTRLGHRACPGPGTSLLQIVMEAAAFKRLPQNCGHLAIQDFKTVAKLQLLVRYDALNGDLNDSGQYVTDECRRENRGDQRSKVRSRVPNSKTCDGGRHPDDDLEKCFH